MANFNTHLSVAAVGSGMLATLCLQIGFVDAKDAILLASMGVLGGILPDVDLHYSHPSRILFSMLGIIAAFLWIFAAENHLSILELWAAGLGIYLIVRYPFWALFQKQQFIVVNSFHCHCSINWPDSDYFKLSCLW